MGKLITEMTEAEIEDVIAKQVPDEEEQEWADIIASGRYESHPNLEQRIAELQAAVRNTDRKIPVTLRLPHDVVDKIKVKARHEGLPYQTMLSSLLYKFAHGRIKELD
jgi:predicted DNA binding CopG/RHH family protein